MLPKSRASLRAVSKPPWPCSPLCKMSAISSSAPSASTPQRVRRSIGVSKASQGCNGENRARAGFGQKQRICANFDRTRRPSLRGPRQKWSGEKQLTPSTATIGVRPARSGHPPISVFTVAIAGTSRRSRVAKADAEHVCGLLARVHEPIDRSSELTVREREGARATSSTRASSASRRRDASKRRCASLSGARSRSSPRTPSRHTGAWSSSRSSRHRAAAGRAVRAARPQRRSRRDDRPSSTAPTGASSCR